MEILTRIFPKYFLKTSRKSVFNITFFETIFSTKFFLHQFDSQLQYRDLISCPHDGSRNKFAPLELYFPYLGRFCSRSWAKAPLKDPCQLVSRFSHEISEMISNHRFYHAGTSPNALTVQKRQKTHGSMQCTSKNHQIQWYLPL